MPLFLPIKNKSGEKIQFKLFLPILRIVVLVLLALMISALCWQYLLNSKISSGLQGVYITDLNDRSAMVSWVTTDPVKTELLYSTNKITLLSNFFGSERGYDRRDLEEVDLLEYKLKKMGKYFVHSVLLRNLTPETQYYFSIKNGIFFNIGQYINTLTTTKSLGEVETPEVAYGKVINQSGGLMSDTLLVFELTNLDDTNKSQQVSYVLDGKTGWSANFSNLWNNSFEEKYTREEETYLKIYIINSNGETTKVVNYKNVRPVENISAYDNNTVDVGTGVKGIMAVACDCRTCNPTCPSGYDYSCASGYNCITTKASCVSRDACTGEACETLYGSTCYKETTRINYSCKCESCTPSCPTGYHFTSCKVGWNCETAVSTCSQYDSCTTERCGSQRGAVCYKETTEKPTEKTKDTCGYVPAENQNYYWCECSGDSTRGSACLGALDLYHNYSSSCNVYCKGTFQKTKTCGSGELASCQYGCESKGPSENDVCKPAPTSIPQEVLCSQEITKQDCLQTDGMCIWESNSCKAFTSTSGKSCSDFNSFSGCNLVYGCEYKNGICQEAKVTVATGNNNEYDTSGFVNLSQSDICTGLELNSVAYAKVTQGTNMANNEEISSYHVGKSSCAIDLSVPTGMPLWNGQVPGLSIEGGKGVWEEGYECTSGAGGGFGNYVDIKQPNGQVIRYAHLSGNSCTGFMSGNTGNSDPGGHLHVEVRVPDAEQANGCVGETNPCNYIPGGCYSCGSRGSGVALNDGDTNVGTQNIPRGINWVSQAFAVGEEWPDASAFVTDKSLQDGVYNISYGSASKTTQFVKTDDNYIVFFTDDNDNGILDENESVLSQSEAEYKYAVQYSRIADSFKIVLQEGLNLISFPIIFKDQNEKEISKVSELIEYLNKGGTQITSIATFRGGKFIVYAIREGEKYGDDFNILPGEGYFLSSLTEGVFLYSGMKVENSLEINLIEGWNLINIYNSNKSSYSGFDILKQIQEGSIDATGLSKWENGKYNSIILKEGSEFGYDFKVYPTRGYFIKVENGKGMFSPK